MTIKELLINYKDVELTKEQEKQIKEYLGIKNKKWKPKQDERYYFIDSLGEIQFDTYFIASEHDEFLYCSNNMFKTKEEAEFILEQIKVYNELKNFADENNDEIDWSNTDTHKYTIEYEKVYKKLKCNLYSFTQHIGQIYFSSHELAKQAIDKVGADRIKKYLFGVDLC